MRPGMLDAKQGQLTHNGRWRVFGTMPKHWETSMPDVATGDRDAGMPLS